MSKPFKTIDEQVAILRQRGMSTDGNTPTVLLTENYYAVVNGYKDPFLIRTGDGERYRPGTRFEDVYSLFLLDRRLRMLLFKYIAVAESKLKTVTAYHFSEAYPGVSDAYLQAGSYRCDGRYKGFVASLINDFEEALGVGCGKAPKKLKPYIQHYLTEYGSVPIWVLMNYLTIGQALQFFDFQKDAVKHRVAKSFAKLFERSNGYRLRITSKTLKKAYDHIKDIRNICAHDERLYSARVSPAENVTLADTIDDLYLALPKEQYLQLRAELIYEITQWAQGAAPNTRRHILKKIGVESIDDFVGVVG